MQRISLALPLRLVSTCIVALALARAVLPPDVVPGAWVLLVWLALCGALGLTSGSRLLLPLIPLPLVGRWYRIATGPEYLTAGERFPLIAEGVYYLVVFAALAVGMEAGVRFHRFLLRRLAGDGSADGGVIFAGALFALVLGGVVLDWQLGPAFLQPPGPIEVRRFSEAELSGIIGAAPYAVYAAPNTEGAPSRANRTVSPGGPSAVPPPQDTTYLIYCDARCRRSSEVQILSEHPDAALRPRSSGGKPPPPNPATFTLGEIIWYAAAAPSPQVARFVASANLGDAYVTIHAPDRATFERVALGLRRIN